MLANIGHSDLFTAFWPKFAPRTQFLPYFEKVCFFTAKFGFYAIIIWNLVRTVNFAQNIEFDNFGQYWSFGPVYSVLTKICATVSIFAVFGRSLLFYDLIRILRNNYLKFSQNGRFCLIYWFWQFWAILIGHLDLFTAFWPKSVPRTQFLLYLEKVCLFMAKFGFDAIITWKLVRKVYVG